MLTSKALWTVFGFLAQFTFTSRMVVQWWTSEKAKKSVVPVTFWLLSLLGSVMLLIYALHNSDYPIALGQATGVLVYMRNLQLIKRTQAAEARAVAAEKALATSNAAAPSEFDDAPVVAVGVPDRSLAKVNS